MGGPPEVEAWAVGNGYRVKVYRETKDGEGYRKMQEYGWEKGMMVGILWSKTRVYEVMLEHEETGEGSTTGEAGRAGMGGGAQVRVGAGGQRGHSVASGESRPLTCGTGSVGHRTEARQMAMQCCCACMQGGENQAEKSTKKKRKQTPTTPRSTTRRRDRKGRVARATRRPQVTRTARETAQERGAGAGGERPVLGAQNCPWMDDDQVGPRHRVAGGLVGYTHGMRDGMGPHDNPGE